MFRPGRRGHYESNRANGLNVLSHPLSNRGRESANKPENIVIRVVQGNWCNSESIRLPPVAHDAFLGQAFTQRPPVLGNSDRELCAAPLFFTRRDDGKVWRGLLS